MKKCFCDRCGKELDYEKMNYVSFMIDDFGNKEQAPESWEFCQDCSSSIKYAILNNIAQYEREGKR